ncbi:MAG: toll/interleukin-1 receptor domain-containing protein [Nitrospinota bacterium]
MRKAFLCHSSKDKEYVRIVARRLTRARIIFDEISFEPGEDFRNEITKRLDAASVFVYFVSKDSLKSVWCNFEVDEAHIRKISGSLDGQLSIIIDRKVKYDDLAKWLRKFKTVIQTRPSQATRDIQHSLFSVLSPQEKKPFIGRQQLLAEFVKSLSTFESKVPNIFVITGSGK